MVDQEIGYELRCVAPCAYDIDYTRNLGFGAVEFLENGESAAMITIQGDQIVPMTFEELQDPKTGKTRVRYVDANSLCLRIAKEYMIRLETKDLEDPDTLKSIAAAAHCSPEQFKEQFGYVACDKSTIKVPT